MVFTLNYLVVERCFTNKSSLDIQMAVKLRGKPVDDKQHIIHSVVGQLQADATSLQNSIGGMNTILLKDIPSFDFDCG